jgi:hypothetical protein
MPPRLAKLAWPILAALALIGLAPRPSAFADSAIPLLSGFNVERLEAAFPPDDESSLGELAKLVYRLRSLDSRSLSRLATDSEAIAIGDALNVQGTITRIQSVAIPNELVEYLELSRLYLIDVAVETGDEQRGVRLVSASSPVKAQIGDRISAVGVVLETVATGEANQRRPLAIACATVRWFPQGPGNVGQELLRENGFELGWLPELASRNRQPLLAEDGDAFYTMIATARSLGENATLPEPVGADPVALLQQPEAMVGQWIQMELESVQVTRVAVTDPMRESQLGSDHYYQIDAVGDLGRVVIKIESPDPDAPPATFQSRFPVSLVIGELPAFLRQRIRQQQAGDAIVAPLRIKLSVNGFFFRLWGYETEFMNQHGGGQQFGPLIVAARLQNREPEVSDPIGVGNIGIAAAVLVVVSMLAIWWWQRRVWAADETARRRRQEQEASQVHLPS